MRYLVTGGAGFIGSNLVDRLLAEGGEVTILDDFNDFYDPAIKRANVAAFARPVRVVEGDLRELSVVRDAVQDADVVVHLAARAGVRPSIEEPRLYFSTNVDGSFNVLEAARDAEIERVIFASSSSVYGVNKKVPFAEADPILRTISPYAATKIAGEQICSNFSYLHDMNVVCLRFFTVYGPRQRPDLAISKFVRLIDEGKPIDRYGSGNTGRDYTYVDDIVQGIMGALAYDGQSFDIFNLGGSHTVTLNEMIAAVEDAMGTKAEINELPEQPGDVPLTSADVSKARAHLGYEPQTPLREGVRKYVEWYRALQSQVV
ncbi:MAG: UDP-glucuronate 4-epimerase [Verrucomicrobiales bacterium]|jgi:UDP-glucuronate 4-epimerase